MGFIQEGVREEREKDFFCYADFWLTLRSVR